PSRRRESVTALFLAPNSKLEAQSRVSKRPWSRTMLKTNALAIAFPAAAGNEQAKQPPHGNIGETPPAGSVSETASWTCPMHPQVRGSEPGECPICGMALEPVTVSAETQNPELADMTRRLWVGAVLTVPILLFAMSSYVPGLNSFLERFVSDEA